MSRLNREQLKQKAMENQEIVSCGRMYVGKQLLDISYKLDINESKEYRATDIDKIDVASHSKANTVCSYIVTAEGSDSVVFDDKYTKAADKVCILNFASSKHPGGGFIEGAMAQEEALCHASNLYSILSEHSRFYNYNIEHSHKGLYSDGIIFSSNVLFFRRNFENISPVFADVITCAAPNRGAALKNGVSDSDVEKTMQRRIEQIIKVAIDNNVKVLALGSFGCGVFKNDAKNVASMMKTVLKDRGLGDYFEKVIFPMAEISGINTEAFKLYF